MSSHDGRQTPFPPDSTMNQDNAPWTHASVARLAAVQALYEIEVAEAPAERVLESLSDGRWMAFASEIEPEDEFADEPVTLPEPNRRMVRMVVHGVLGDLAALDEQIVSQMSDAESFRMLEAVARAILRAAAYELSHTPQVPVGTITSDYVAIANAFFTESQPSMINAVVDGMATRVRGSESKANLAG